jgi:hypothetical protein
MVGMSEIVSAISGKGKKRTRDEVSSDEDA